MTLTSTFPEACAEVMHEICDDEIKTTELHGAPPKEAVMDLRKFAPLIVTIVPPAGGPAGGETEVMDGDGRFDESAVVLALTSTWFSSV